MRRIHLLISTFVVGFASLTGAAVAQQDIRLVLYEDPEVIADRLNYPLLITQSRGYRVHCRSHTEEEAVIRGLGFLTAPSEILSPVDPDIIAADPAGNPLLCPTGDDYPIKVFAADSGNGLNHYFQFPEAIGASAFTDRIYIPGCTELVDALGIDLANALDADPTPFFTEKIHEISCISGTDLEVAPETFADWCVKGDRTPEETSAVMALLDITPVGITALGNPESCDAASEFLDSIQVINISGKGVKSLAPVATLRQTTRLLAADNEITDLSPLVGMAALTVLDLSDNDISNIAALAPLSTLNQLNLDGNRVEDVRSLSALTLLTSLSLNDNRIDDLGPLQFLAALSELSLAGNGLSGGMIEPLTALAALMLLDLSDNMIETFEHLGVFPSTVSIDLSGNPIVDGGAQTFLDICILNRDQPTPFGQTVRAIVELHGGGTCSEVNNAVLAVTSLDLSTQVISHLGPLASLSHLVSLNLSDNAITDIAPLAGLVNLRTLNLANNSIVDIRPVGPLVNLTSFDASANPLALDSFLAACLMRDHADTLTPAQSAEVEALLTASGASVCQTAHDALRRTHAAQATNASLTSVQYFAVLENVRSLDISNNQISDVSALQALPALRTLRVANNRISSFSSVASIRQLTSLTIDRNPFQTLNGINNMQGLQRLFMSHTGVRRIGALGSLPALEDAGLRGLNLLYANFREYCLVNRFDPVALGSSRPFMEAVRTALIAVNIDPNDCAAVEEWADDVEVLNFNKKGITSVNPIVFFTDLKELHLFDNHISDPGPITNLTGLEKLNLTANSLTTAPRLRSTGLRQLLLRDNRIVSINNLSNLTLLQTLNLRGNRVVDPATVNQLTALNFLDLRDNRISAFNKATAILGRNPYLKGNPVCQIQAALLPFQQACTREPPLIVFPIPEIGGLITTPSVSIDVERRIEALCPNGRCPNVTVRRPILPFQ